MVERATPSSPELRTEIPHWKWMKERFGLPPEQPAYAWSFELIAPENGLLLGDGVRSLECPRTHAWS
jgi:hypothetical protein